MTKKSAILQKKVKQLESELNQLFSLPPDQTPCDQRFFQDIQQRLLFLKTLLSAEIASRPRNPPYHLQHLAKRLLKLEAAFQQWDSFQSSAPDHVEKGSTCSCTESCLIDDGGTPEGSSETLMSLADLEQLAEASIELSLAGLDLEGFDDEDGLVPVPVSMENIESSSTRVNSEAETEKGREEERVRVEAERSMVMMRKEKTNGVWFGNCLGILSSGVVLGMVLMAFFMAIDSDCTSCLTPT
ncbi:hypothetical protein PTKIN_Ptkin04bG0005000 [Pterospermum kingtungense]